MKKETRELLKEIRSTKHQRMEVIKKSFLQAVKEGKVRTITIKR